MTPDMNLPTKLFLLLFIAIASLISGKKVRNNNNGYEATALIVVWIGIVWAMILFFV